MGNASMIDSMLHDGLTDAMLNIHMGETAENLAKQYEISRAVRTIDLRTNFVVI
jgi:acetyl-CoA C-acetyltransferase